MKPRVVGSPGHTEVQSYLKSTLASFGWTVITDRFDEKTPMGVKTFENIIAYSNPNAERYLLLAAHYDSKYFAEGEFLGATDSAVPCAMMINLLKTLQGAAMVELQSRTTQGLMLVFFDGEEAFENWSATDSIYGARHLAQRWENENFLSKIELFVLLDLLGTPDPNFYSYFKNTNEDYARMMRGESKLTEGGHLIKQGSSGVVNRSGQQQYFQPHSVGMGIEDDHIPFMKRGVPILHVIPTPFPDVWHKMGDDGECIDYDTVENLSRILRLFVVEYLGMGL